jgi:hypothetical protein
VMLCARRQKTWINKVNKTKIAALFIFIHPPVALYWPTIDYYIKTMILQP